MRQKILNNLLIEVDGLDLTSVTNIEFYVRQGVYDWTLPVTVNDASSMLVVFPKEYAMNLCDTEPVELQFAFTDKNGNPDASDPLTISVGRLIKEAGYDPT